MKRIFGIFLLVLCITLPALADSTEKARVIKFDLDTKDLIVERASGEKLIIQHNRTCNSMNTEFPVDLIWSNGDLVQLKVNYNEMCTVYNWGPYSSDAKVIQRIIPPNPLETEHFADLQWKDIIYRIDYGQGCRFLKEFIDKQVYVYTPNGTLDGATLYLPNNRGECSISTGDAVAKVTTPTEVSESPIYDIRYIAENNEATFYWKTKESDEKWLVLIAYSKFQLNPSDYHWRQMPNLRFSASDRYTAKTLVNGQKYYFYISARDSEGLVAPWQELEITPIQTKKAFVNHPDPEEFEIEVTAYPDHYTLEWPDKSEDARRYLIQLFVDGKRTLLKIIDGTIHTWQVDITPETLDSRYRMVVQSMPKEQFGPRHSDSIFWRAGAQ